MNEGYLLRICVIGNVTYMEGFIIHLSEFIVEEPRPYNLLQCLSDVENDIDRLMSIEDIDGMINNMVHVDDEFICNGTVTVTRMEYEQASLDSVKVRKSF